MSKPKKPDEPRKKVGARSKYTPEVVQAICDAIAKTGGLREGWEAGGISQTTLHEWRDKHPEFSEKVANAQREYRENCPEVQIAQAKKALNDYLFGRVVQVWTTEEIIEGPDGTTVKKSVKTVNKGPAEWAIRRTLGDPMDWVTIVQRLAETGMLSPESLSDIENKINEMKMQILGKIVGNQDVDNT